MLLSKLQRDVTKDHLSVIVLAPLWMVWQATKALTSQPHHLLPNREVLASQCLHLVHVHKHTSLRKPRGCSSAIVT